MPTPIDRSQLSWGIDKAVPCWQYNTFRALDYFGCRSPVAKVWTTSEVLYRENSDGVRSTVGTRCDTPVYATKEEAWEACITEVRAWCETRIKELQERANAECAFANTEGDE